MLVQDGVAVIAFQSGFIPAVERPNAYGTGVDHMFLRHDPGSVTAGLATSGLDIAEVIERKPIFHYEDTAQAFIVACA